MARAAWLAWAVLSRLRLAKVVRPRDSVGSSAAWAMAVLSVARVPEVLEVGSTNCSIVLEVSVSMPSTERRCVSSLLRRSATAATAFFRSSESLPGLIRATVAL